MSGKLSIIGTGPGRLDQFTGRALEAIREADAVIGYKTYLKLVDKLLAGKEVIGTGMTQELERCADACRRAMEGQTVALISSGDPGVYGMAGPAYEILLKSGWSPASETKVEVIPGVTALAACASLAGAPLTHDFCAISLSDLMTPWEVIVKRLEAAAAADFVTTLYNPKSKKRVTQIVEAQEIFLKHRAPETPVAIISAAYREKETVQLTDLAHMAASEMGMQTTVIIGNSRTFLQAGTMVTPRGYGDKYGIDEVSAR